MAEDFRMYRLSSDASLTDTLKIRNVLYHSWKALRILLDELPSTPGTDPLALEQLLVAKFPERTSTCTISIMMTVQEAHTVYRSKG